MAMKGAQLTVCKEGPTSFAAAFLYALVTRAKSIIIILLLEPLELYHTPRHFTEFSTGGPARVFILG